MLIENHKRFTEIMIRMGVTLCRKQQLQHLGEEEDIVRVVVVVYILLPVLSIFFIALFKSRTHFNDDVQF